VAARKKRTRRRVRSLREDRNERGPGDCARRPRQQGDEAGSAQRSDLPLSDALFANDAVCFLDCSSRSLAFYDALGASITMEFPDFRHAALWTRAGAPFVCLEAWTGYSDPEGFAGDLFDKPSMRALGPGGRARHEARFIYRAA
jgi:hypothetical protein